MTLATIDQKSFDDLRQFFETETSISLGDDKRYLIETRLKPILKNEGCHSWGDLLVKSKNDRSHRIRDQILDAMTTNETLWFRDEGPFTALRDKLLPRFADEIRSGKRDKIRIWSSACSTGQEPYSVMITALEFIRTQTAIKPEHIEILASDISDTALAEAKSGSYNSVAMSRGLAPEVRNRYFVENGRNWEVKPELRERITFRKFNLQDSFSLLGKFDIILNRYVSIYFSDEFKRGLYRKLHNSLEAKGHLFLGASESLDGYSDEFVTFRHGRAIYYQAMNQGANETLTRNLDLMRSQPNSLPKVETKSAAAVPPAATTARPEKKDPTDLSDVLAMLKEMNTKFDT